MSSRVSGNLVRPTWVKEVGNVGQYSDWLNPSWVNQLFLKVEKVVISFKSSMLLEVPKLSDQIRLYCASMANQTLKISITTILFVSMVRYWSYQRPIAACSTLMSMKDSNIDLDGYGHKRSLMLDSKSTKNQNETEKLKIRTPNSSGGEKEPPARVPGCGRICGWSGWTPASCRCCRIRRWCRGLPEINRVVTFHATAPAIKLTIVAENTTSELSFS